MANCSILIALHVIGISCSVDTPKDKIFLKVVSSNISNYIM